MTTTHLHKVSTEIQPKNVRLERADISEGVRPNISMNQGDYSSGVIHNVAVISGGEALGHGMWIDSETLDQVNEAGQAADTGIKARFTHPGMSSDGLGRALGRVKNMKRWGDKVVGDLHFFESAHKTPEGDLAEYVMLLTTEDPSAAGLSIVFEADEQLQDEFIFENSVNGEFTSPDAMNINSYPHARIGKLRAADVVDEPAANPEGMFHRNELPSEAFAFMDYASSESENKPQSLFGIDPDRARSFFQRWLNENKLELLNTSTESIMDAANTELPSVTAREELLADHAKFTEEFGVENGTSWFQEGITLEVGYERYCEELKADNKHLNEMIVELQKKLSQVQIGETDPIATADETETSETPKTFASMFNIRGSENN